jgi:cell wall-associated NlpC family hydrolase
MEYGTCNLAVIPMRAEANERSEQVSQVLFGEVFEIVEYAENWIKIITAFDNYTGWIARLQFISIEGVIADGLAKNTPALTFKPVTVARKVSDGSLLYLPAGSSLPFLDGDICRIGDELFEIAELPGKSESLVQTARSYLNSPYLWGGRTHLGIDCSGFTQAVFKLQGIRLLRDASLQAAQGEPVVTLNEAKTGDLAFFTNAQGRIAHVGILLNNREIIHASGKVKIDAIDEQGIYSNELKRRTHQLKTIKRVL